MGWGALGVLLLAALLPSPAAPSCDPMRNGAWTLLKGGRDEGDEVVIVAGAPPGIPGSTNALRIHKMGDAINGVAPAYRRP